MRVWGAFLKKKVIKINLEGPNGVQNLFCFGANGVQNLFCFGANGVQNLFCFGANGVQNLFCFQPRLIDNDPFFGNTPDIAFPDLMTYSYISKIEPQNKFGTKKTAK